LHIRASADGTDGVSIWYDRSNGVFCVDDVETSVPLDPDATIGLNIFVDRSIIEAYLKTRRLSVKYSNSDGDNKRE
jgi:sucrose-6-phosphate hydrolase SacC (GH32 family)